MVSFRFHLVSLIGVFLALGIGIAVGASVVDRATVTALERQLDAVGARADATNAENDRLRVDVERWERFADQAGDELVEGLLAGAEVIVVGVNGIDGTPVDSLRQSLLNAGARVHGTVWLTGRLRLAEPAQVQGLADALGVSPGSADLMRQALVDRVAAWLATGAVSPLPPLRDAGFVDVDGGLDPTLPPPPGVRVVVVSGAKAEVPNEDLAVPLVAELARQAPRRVLAAEAGREPTAEAPAERAVFVGPLRADDRIDDRISTVDHLESYRGRVAAVLAVADLGEAGKVGHYGVGSRATRLVPEQSS
jgi:hypothetical protein